MASSDPLDELAHDHGQLSVLVFEVLNALESKTASPRPVEQRWLRDHLIELREALLLHFAREEEGLFPFVGQHFPEAASRVAAMEVAHDGMCGSVTRMAYLAEQAADAFPRHLQAIAASFMRFLDGYVSHSRVESELIEELAGRLDTEQRATLAELIRGI
jgi:iron-sulfur cluster repair protein YtfE (RIC family)